jgi:hypothetical protein
MIKEIKKEKLMRLIKDGFCEVVWSGGTSQQWAEVRFFNGRRATFTLA